MTEKMSKAMLDVVGIASGSLIGPVVRSQAGKTFLSMVPGEVLLASLDAVSKFKISNFQHYKTPKVNQYSPRHVYA